MIWNVISKVLWIFISLTDDFFFFINICILDGWIDKCVFALYELLIIPQFSANQCCTAFFSSNLHCTSVNYHTKINMSVSFTHFSDILYCYYQS